PALFWNLSARVVLRWSHLKGCQLLKTRATRRCVLRTVLLCKLQQQVRTLQHDTSSCVLSGHLTEVAEERRLPDHVLEGPLVVDRLLSEFDDWTSLDLSSGARVVRE